VDREKAKDCTGVSIGSCESDDAFEFRSIRADPHREKLTLFRCPVFVDQDAITGEPGATPGPFGLLRALFSKCFAFCWQLENVRASSADETIVAFARFQCFLIHYWWANINGGNPILLFR
jgi:hypothetical protein